LNRPAWVLSAAAGLVLGFVATKLLFLGGLTLLPWAVAALLIGWLSRDAKLALVNGAIYGFVLSFVFMLAGYEGDAVVDKMPFFVLLGIFGGVCGLIWAWLGRFLHARFAWKGNDWG
jgi:hypothetical protein